MRIANVDRETGIRLNAFRARFHEDFMQHTAKASRIFTPERRRAAPTKGAPRMTFDLALVGFVALGLLVYLTAVLIRPERF